VRGARTDPRNQPCRAPASKGNGAVGCTRPEHGPRRPKDASAASGPVEARIVFGRAERELRGARRNTGLQCRAAGAYAALFAGMRGLLKQAERPEKRARRQPIAKEIESLAVHGSNRENAGKPLPRLVESNIHSNREP